MWRLTPGASDLKKPSANGRDQLHEVLAVAMTTAFAVSMLQLLWLGDHRHLPRFSQSRSTLICDYRNRDTGMNNHIRR